VSSRWAAGHPSSAAHPLISRASGGEPVTRTIDGVMRRFLSLVLLVSLLAVACGSSESSSPNAQPAPAGEGAGIRLVSAEQGAAIQTDPPQDLVILDVRTPEEFAAGHLDGAIMLDFYRDDFAVALEELDPDVPYLLYCRSGNRSGQTALLMEQLGFTDVADVDGGIRAWNEAGLPTFP